MIRALAEGEWPDAPYEGSALASPVFLDLNDAQRLALPPLEFLGHFKKGVGLMLTNSGETGTVTDVAFVARSPDAREGYSPVKKL